MSDGITDSMGGCGPYIPGTGPHGASKESASKPDDAQEVIPGRGPVLVTYCATCDKELKITEVTCGGCGEGPTKVKPVKFPCSVCNKEILVPLRPHQEAKDVIRAVCVQCEHEQFVGSMFDTAAPSKDQIDIMAQTRDDAQELALKMARRGGMNACTKIALRKLQEAVMYANRAVLEID